MSIQLINGDCLEEMKSIPDVSVDLVLADPPYNIGKAEWDNVDNYIEWCGKWFLECQRVLKSKGSFYFFHNDFLQVVDLQKWISLNTDFIFKQLIIWNKRYEGCNLKGYLDWGVSVDINRNYSKQAEYILYYVFQDETGLTTVMLDTNNFSTLRQYFKNYQEALGLSLKQINHKFGHRKADHAFYWKTTQWGLPTKEVYSELSKLPVYNGFLRREYEDLRREYEDLRREYEDLRYTFNNQKTHHSVWNYGIAEKLDHETPKPVKLIENIILHSSNENDTVLDPFMGSGTTGVACVNLNRSFIGIELDEFYFDDAAIRIDPTYRNPKDKKIDDMLDKFFGE